MKHKKIFCTILASALLISQGAFATTAGAKEDIGVTGESTTLEAAYIEFTEAMVNHDIDVLLPFDSFVENYNLSSEDDIDTYLEEVIRVEIENHAVAEATDSTIIGELEPIPITNPELESAYETLIETYPYLSMSYEDFIEEYALLGSPDIDSYLESFDDVLVPPADVSPNAGEEQWYHNTGTSLPQRATYSDYGLLHTVKKGDLIHEAEGAGGLGHIAVVEGIFYDMTYNQFYVRLIEGIQRGVCRGVLDDTRIDRQGGTVLRVTESAGATDRIKNEAVAFCISQLGKGYELDLCHHTSPNQYTWYCSELAWAAYKNQGIDIEMDDVVANQPGITPRDILYGTKTSTVNYNTSISFTDISTHPAKTQMQYLANNGLMTGVTSSECQPNSTLSRAMVATGLYRLEGTPTNIGSEPFTDVGNSSWYSLAVSWAYTKGIVTGMTSTTFSPDTAVTREQLATFLYRYAQYKGLDTSYANNLGSFSDGSSVSEYALTPVKWAVKHNLLSAVSGTTLAPQQNATRAQFAVAVYNLVTGLM